MSIKSPIISYTGTKYYDQGVRYKAEPRDFLQKDAALPEESLGLLFAKKPTLLPAETSAFFARYPMAGFHPYHADKQNPVHKQFKKIVDDFETYSRDRPLKEKIKIAEQLVSEIRIADGLQQKKISTLEEMHSSAKELLDAPAMSLEELEEYFKERGEIPKSDEERSHAILFEIGARFYLACSLFKTQSGIAATKTEDIATIYNFMTKSNTYKPYWGGLRLAMHPNLLGRIGANIADRLTLAPSLDATLAQGNSLVAYHVNKMKTRIEKSKNEDVVYLDGGLKDGPIAQNKSIDIFVKSSEIMYRHMLARKIVSSLAAAYKPLYQKTGQLPKDIERTIAKITAFLQVPSEPAAIRRALPSPCDPAKELIQGIFGTSQDARALIEKVERDAAVKHEKAASWRRFVPFTRTLSHAEIERIKERKIQAIQWAAKML